MADRHKKKNRKKPQHYYTVKLRLRDQILRSDAAKFWISISGPTNFRLAFFFF